MLVVGSSEPNTKERTPLCAPLPSPVYGRGCPNGVRADEGRWGSAPPSLIRPLLTPGAPSRALRAKEEAPSLEMTSQLLERQSRAGLVVLRTQARRQVLEQHGDLRSAGCLLEGHDEPHLTETGRIAAVEIDGFDDSTRRIELHVAHRKPVLLLGCLAAEILFVWRI